MCTETYLEHRNLHSTQTYLYLCFFFKVKRFELELNKYKYKKFENNSLIISNFQFLLHTFLSKLQI